MKDLMVEKSRLSGEVRVSGAKNSVLKLLAASLISEESITLANFPASLLDVQVQVEMLRLLGKVCEESPNCLRISETTKGLATRLEWNGRSIRTTLLILGALVARFGEAAVPLPGGCKLGERAYDIHVTLLQALGAEVWEENDMLLAVAPQGLQGTDIHLPVRSTGATENAIIAGCLARGITQIWNPHIRPEILKTVEFLNEIGASIRVFGQERIEVEGVNQFNSVRHKIMPDNMEAITWLSAAVMTGGDVEIHDFPRSDLEVALIHLRESGARFYEGPESIIVRGGQCYPLEISTGPHPGINSDVQPILAAYAACARGESRIVDLRFRDRYRYAEEFKKMGVKCSVDGDVLRIMGARGRLRGAKVKALDLRAGAALTLAGLVASGTTTISDAWQLERGYDKFVEKLKSLGAHVSATE